MKSGVITYFEDFLEQQAAENDITVEEFLEAMEVSSVEEFLTANGMDLDDMFDTELLLSAFDAVESSGTYEAKDGELRLTSSADNSIDIESYEFDSDTQISLKDQSDDGELGDIVLVKK